MADITAGAQTEGLLVARLRAGDEAAFCELYETYCVRLYGYLASVLDDDHGAEDVLQETLIAVMSGIEGFDPERGSLGPWIAGIAKNKMLERLRADRRHRAEPPERISGRFDRSTGSADVSEPEWLSDPRLLPILRRLPAEQRRVLLLRHVADLSSEEAGLALGRTAASVRQLDRRARQFVVDRIDAMDSREPSDARPPIGREPAVQRAGMLRRVRLSPVLRSRTACA